MAERGRHCSTQPKRNIPYLRNSTEVKHTLVPEPWQVGDDVGDMVQGVGYEFIQALHGHIYVFWLSKVFQLLNVSAPHLAVKKVQNQSRGAQVENLHVL